MVMALGLGRVMILCISKLFESDNIEERSVREKIRYMREYIGVEICQIARAILCFFESYRSGFFQVMRLRNS